MRAISGELAMKLLFCPQLCTLPPGPSILLSVLSLRRAVNRLGLSHPGQGFSLPGGCVCSPRPTGSCLSSPVPPPGLPRRQTAFEIMPAYFQKHSDAAHQGTKQNCDSFIEAINSVSVAKTE